MTPKQYFIAKNVIAIEELGVTLIPSDQIEDVATTELVIKNMQMYIKRAEEDVLGAVLAHDNCPYCVIYQTAGQNCGDCPMAREGNRCFDEFSTFDICETRIKEPGVNQERLVERLLDLAKKFVKENT